MPGGPVAAGSHAVGGSAINKSKFSGIAMIIFSAFGGVPLTNVNFEFVLLKDDQQHISHQFILIILVTAIETVGYFCDREKTDSEKPTISNRTPDLSQQPLTHQDARDFWWDFIGFLKANDKVSNIRVITDNVRLESMAESGPYLNPFAVQNILRFMRGRLHMVPVLVYTGRSIRSMVFVSEFVAADLTSDQRVCLQYISNLVAEIKDVSGWQGFDRVIHPGYHVKPCIYTSSHTGIRTRERLA
ncbi:hypothetical protein CVT25_004073 [Psilocybe cyanescens]|uniref:Uncharacterized protein n=1 Tax=Psilocybe cyanescens TaxID=93625 RepID=A0A409XPT8_PSICY|nr:hypothetical protein CVT25_004073 [Psilocybe cyanescens]